MEEIVEKTIYERLLDQCSKIQGLKIDETDRSKLVRWIGETYYIIIKICGRNTTFTLESRKLFELIRRRNNELPIESINIFINKIINFTKTLERLNQNNQVINISEPSLPPDTKDIFIIHGHDVQNALMLSHIIQNEFKLNPIGIFLKPGQSSSILNKFEIHANTCSFAFALFSKDDIIKKENEEYSQARPNVVFESGWLTGRLGRKRIVLLLQREIKIHSDYVGISRIEFDKNIEEKFKEIKNELEAANLIKPYNP